MAMAPTSTIETVLIVRPLKVTAFVCGIVAGILLIVAICTTAWLETEGTRQGLWDECIRVQEKIDCHQNNQEDWILACAGLCIIALLISFAATVLTGVGLATKDVVWKFKFYRIAMYIMFLAVLLLVIALIVFPVMFLKDIETRINKKWYFGWGYGVAWGATVFILGAAILLLVDKESEEIFYREKTYYHHEEEGQNY